MKKQTFAEMIHISDTATQLVTDCEPFRDVVPLTRKCQSFNGSSEMTGLQGVVTVFCLILTCTFQTHSVSKIVRPVAMQTAVQKMLPRKHGKNKMLVGGVYLSGGCGGHVVLSATR